MKELLEKFAGILAEAERDYDRLCGDGTQEEFEARGYLDAWRLAVSLAKAHTEAQS